MSPSPVRLCPEPVPGGALIGSVNSRFTAAAFAPDVSVYYPPATRESDPPQHNPRNKLETQTHHTDALAVIQILHRAEMEALVTRAWLHTVHNQSEDNLRHLLRGALKHNILSEDDIARTCGNPFSRLPIKVPFLFRADIDPTPGFVVFDVEGTDCVSYAGE